MTQRVLADPPALRGLYAKVVAGALPGVGAWRRRRPAGLGTTGVTTGVASSDDELAALTVRLTDVSIEATRLAAYRRVCGFPSVSSPLVPATYPHVVAFPLHLLVMTDERFPYRPLGLVHIANTITQRRPIGLRDIFDLVVSAHGLAAHPKGRQVTILSEAEIGGEVVWRDETVLLHREATPQTTSGAASDGQANLLPDSLPDTAPDGPLRWRLPADLGRRYAGVSGDRNPIHLYDVTARPFGFSRHLAHGMWTKARCLAELYPRLRDDFSVHVVFKKPVTLPGSVSFGARVYDRYLDFGVSATTSRAPHLLGRVTQG